MCTCAREEKCSFFEPFVEFWGKLEFGKDKNVETVRGSFTDNGEIFDRVVDKVFDAYDIPNHVMFKVSGTEAEYNLRTNRLKVHGYFYTYGYFETLDVTVKVSKKEREFIINALDDYCQTTCKCSCLERLNKTRKRKKLEPLSGPVSKKLDKVISDAESQKNRSAKGSVAKGLEER